MERDLIGYADRPPAADWPGRARVAVNFVLNYEEGSEQTIGDGDGRVEVGLAEAPGGRLPPGQRDLAFETMYEFGSRVGFWRVMRLFAERGLPMTIFGCALALERNPRAVEAIVAAGHDICSHGWRWIEHFRLSEAEEREHIARAVESIRRTSGERPAGWYCRYGPSGNTRRLLVEEGGFLYDSDAYNDELPYWTRVAGRSHLVVPYTMDTNDSKFTLPGGFGTGDAFFTYLRDAFDQLYEEGAETPRLMSVGLHPRIVGRPGRARGLARFLDHVLAHDRVWVARRVDVARHWVARHPPPGA
ncbi:allantoinase PuuE [Stella sp.]|uniref:allantoinase PuuE n=1 Tax=Stella sp. TaxID=2912054 RepID=UPI0035AEC7A6